MSALLQLDSCLLLVSLPAMGIAPNRYVYADWERELSDAFSSCLHFLNLSQTFEHNQIVQETIDLLNEVNVDADAKHSSMAM